MEKKEQYRRYKSLCWELHRWCSSISVRFFFWGYARQRLHRHILTCLIAVLDAWVTPDLMSVHWVTDVQADVPSDLFGPLAVKQRHYDTPAS